MKNVIKFCKKHCVLLLLIIVIGSVLYRFQISSTREASCYILYETIKPIETNISKNIETRVQELESKSLSKQAYECFEIRYKEYANIISIDKNNSTKLGKKYKKDYENLKAFIEEYKSNSEKYLETKDNEYRKEAIKNYELICEMYEHYSEDEKSSVIVEPLYS